MCLGRSMKTEYTPHAWCLVKYGDDMRVMATWSGGYLYGDSWRLNSGIDDIEETEDSWKFIGFSGSVYECRKDGYGINGYGLAVLACNKLHPLEEGEAMEYIRGLTKPVSSDTLTT